MVKGPSQAPTTAVVSTYRMGAVIHVRRFVTRVSTTTRVAIRMFAALAPEIQFPTAARGVAARAVREPSPAPTTALAWFRMDAATRGRRFAILASTTRRTATRMFALIVPQARCPTVAPEAATLAAQGRSQTPITGPAWSAAQGRFPTPATAPVLNAVRERL